MKLKLYSLLLATALVTFSCKKYNNYSQAEKVVQKDYRVTVSPDAQNFPVSRKLYPSSFSISFFTDKSVVYQFADMPAKDSGEWVIGVEINLGGPFTDNGTLLLSLPGRYRSGAATGSIENIRPTLFDSLMNDDIPKYVNIRTTYNRGGLFRGQLNEDLIYSIKQPLNGAVLNPTISSPTTGVLNYRIGYDRNRNLIRVYSKFDIANDEVSDPVNGAKLFFGRVNATGAATPLFTLASSPSQLTNAQVFVVSNPPLVGALVNGQYHVRVTSSARPTGKIGGQLK